MILDDVETEGSGTPRIPDWLKIVDSPNGTWETVDARTGEKIGGTRLFRRRVARREACRCVDASNAWYMLRGKAASAYG